jgi:predicted outer membrane repeat protein
MAADGDTVEAACGTCHEHDTLVKDQLVLRSETGLPDCAVIDAQRIGRVMSGDALLDVTIEGFTMTNGCMAFVDGGGLRLSNCRVALRGCRFVRNTSYGASAGGGGYVVAVDVADCLFRGNTAVQGGALACPEYEPTSITVSRSRFLANQCGLGGGAALVGVEHSMAEVVECEFRENHAWIGGAICGNGWLTLSRCVVVDNVAEAAWGRTIGMRQDWEHTAWLQVGGCTLARA